MKKTLLTLLTTLVTTITFCQNVPSYVPINGLVGWYPFNGNANDESGGNNNGTINGAVLTTDRYGNANSAMNFNGNCNISCPNAPLINLPITISAWINTSNANTNPIISLGDLGTIDTRKFAFFSSQNDNFGVYNTPSVGVCGSSDVTTTYDLMPVNSWVHLAFVVNSFNVSGVTFYINGQPYTQNTTGSLNPNPFPLNNAGFTIGSTTGYCFTATGVPLYFTGSIDDIGIWNRALSQQEISSLYGNNCFQLITVTDTLLINMGLTNTNPLTYNNTIRIYPNPSNDHITIDNGNFASLSGHVIKITNSTGQQVFQSAITQQQFYIDLTTWGGAGLYFVNIINPYGVIIDTKKIVIQ